MIFKECMNHRERVIAALNHEQPDRCPMQISFTPEFAARLRTVMGVTNDNGHNPHGSGNSYCLERALGQDLLLTSVGWANCYYQSREPYTDEWGVEWRPARYQTPFGTGYYTEVYRHPISTAEDLARYRVPDPNRAELYLEAGRMIRQYRADYWIVGVTVTTIWETAMALRGMERLLMDVLAEPDFADALLDIPFRYHLAAASRLVRMGVDMIWMGDDVGSQKGMILSPELWRRFLKPRMAEFIATLKGINSAIKVAYHSDGDIYPIIPELIEIGLDVLNPVQPACMDPARLKREFGGRLCFWGSIDEQHTLPFGTPAQVAAEVHERLRTVGRGGGLILGPTHHVQLDTPIENFNAMIEAITGNHAKEWCGKHEIKPPCEGIMGMK